MQKTPIHGCENICSWLGQVLGNSEKLQRGEFQTYAIEINSFILAVSCFKITG
jgi:hypothetical protein